MALIRSIKPKQDTNADLAADCADRCGVSSACTIAGGVADAAELVTDGAVTRLSVEAPAFDKGSAVQEVARVRDGGLSL